MRLEFGGQTPTPDEVSAIIEALRTVYRVSGSTALPPSIWKLAMLYPDASIDELRSVKLGSRDVF